MVDKYKNKGEHAAFDEDGNQLDIPPEDVRRYTLSFLDDPESKMLLIIAIRPDGDLLVNVFEKPSRRIYDLLAQALEQYDNALRLNGV